MSRVSEKQLIAQAQSGDIKAFEQLVVRYQPRIYDLVYRFVNDSNLVRDITQEIFLKAYRSINQFEGRSKFYTWLYTISLNSIRNHHKFMSRRPVEIDVDMFKAENILDQLKMRERIGPESEVVSEDFEDLVFKIVDDLPENLRLGIMLREIIGLPYDEIALVMQCPIGTVRSRLARARDMIDEQLKIYFAPDE